MTIEGTAMRRQIIVTCAFLGLIVLAGAAPASAQRTTATLAGLVVDSSGGALPGATVELVNEDTSVAEQPQVTGATGEFVFKGNGADKSTPLVMAISSGHYGLGKLLLDRGADPNRANDDGLTPLYATIEKQFAPVSWSLTRPTDQERVTHLELMKALLARGADPNARLTKKLWFRPSDHDDVWIGTAGTTAFWRAAFANDVDAMRLLVVSGADPNIPSLEMNSPLMAAAGVGWTAALHRTVPDARIAAVKLCLELGGNMNAVDAFNYTALHGAAYRGDNDLVKFLVDKGARMDVRTVFGTSVTDMANGFVAYSSLPRVHPETVRLLVGLGAPEPSPERVGVSAYCNAAALNCPQIAEVR